MKIAIDTETYLIKGRNVPPLICVSYAEQIGETWSAGVLRGQVARDYIESALKHHEVIMHNASFDLCVIARRWPSLIPVMFDALREGRIYDTKLRERLHKIARGGSGDGILITEEGGKLGKLSLGGLVYKYLGVDISDQKTSGVRYEYDELASIPLEEWGDEAVDYSAQDALLTGLVYDCQRAEIPEEELVDEVAQVRADVTLKLIGSEGIRVNQDAVGDVRCALQEELDTIGARIKKTELMDRRGKLNTDAMRARIEIAHIELGLEVPKTDTGNVSTARDALLASQDPDLADVNAYKQAQKLLSTYVGELESASHYGGILRAEYSVLKITGRTSCARPNLQNLPRRGGIRDCFIPREGCVFVLCDYDAVEMRTLAQCYRDLVGRDSPLGDMYREDPQFDPHSYFGAQLLGIDYREMLQRVEADDPQANEYRQRAKPANFGYAGGMGAGAFVAYARGYGVELNEREAQELRDAWIETYDMRAWFRCAERASESGRVLCPSSQRLRGNPRYTEACNMPFQGMASDGAKRALFEVARECWADPDSPLFGSRPLVFVHDEIILECPVERGHEVAMRLREIMVREMEICTPDIPASATPALATRWAKGAKPKYDDAGRLVPWV